MENQIEDIIHGQIAAHEAQRDFAGQIQASIADLAKSLQDAHDQLALQGNEVINNLNSTACRLTAQIDRIQAQIYHVQRSFKRTVVAALAVTALALFSAGILVVGPLVREATMPLIRETMGARSSVEQWESRDVQPPTETDQEEAVSSQQADEYNAAADDLDGEQKKSPVASRPIQTNTATAPESKRDWSKF